MIKHNKGGKITVRVYYNPLKDIPYVAHCKYTLVSESDMIILKEK